MPYYPAKNQGNRNQLQPYQQPRIPKSIIPQGSKDRNIAGQVKTIIHMKNAKGEEMTVYQTQQMLNLMNGNIGNWMVGNNLSQNKRRNRR